jgi:hypothetical protein
MRRKGKSANIAVRFADLDVDQIIQSLPNGVAQKRLKLLPEILHEWGRTELPRHLSLESLKIIRDRGKKVEVFEKRARALLQAFDALDDLGLQRVAHRMATDETSNIAQTDLQQELGALCNFLTRLASAEPHASQKSKRGQPRNYVAYLVILDIAAIFEWLTKTKPTREVDREGKGGKGDIGPFWKFAEAIWPLVFCKGRFGLSSAIKNWAGLEKDWKRKRSEGEKSPLINNIALRHPSWGVFEN